MRRTCWMLLLTLALLLAGCGTPPPSAQSIPPTPALSTTPNPSSAQNISASVVVQPALQSQMSFLIQAVVKEVDVREGDSVQPGQTLIVLNTPQLSFSVEAAQASVRSAQAAANLRRYPRKSISQAGSVVYLSGPPELRQIADARLQQAQASLEIAQVLDSESRLLAPYQGTIATINVVPGQLVLPGQVVSVIADLDHLLIDTTDLSARDIAKIKIGQTAAVHLKAFSQDFGGTVIAIAPRAGTSAGNPVFKVTIALDSPPPGLLWGMSGTVDLQTK